MYCIIRKNCKLLRVIRQEKKKKRRNKPYLIMSLTSMSLVDSYRKRSTSRAAVTRGTGKSLARVHDLTSKLTPRIVCGYLNIKLTFHPIFYYFKNTISPESMCFGREAAFRNPFFRQAHLEFRCNDVT